MPSRLLFIKQFSKQVIRLIVDWLLENSIAESTPKCYSLKKNIKNNNRKKNNIVKITNLNLDEINPMI